MSIDKPGGPTRGQRVSAKGLGSIVETARSRLEAVTASAVSDHFIGTPPRHGFDLRHLGIGRNVDVYA